MWRFGRGLWRVLRTPDVGHENLRPCDLLCCVVGFSLGLGIAAVFGWLHAGWSALLPLVDGCVGLVWSGRFIRSYVPVRPVEEWTRLPYGWCVIFDWVDGPQVRVGGKR